MGAGWKYSDNLSKLLYLCWPASFFYGASVKNEWFILLGFIAIIWGLTRAYENVKLSGETDYDNLPGFIVVHLLMYGFYTFLALIVWPLAILGIVASFFIFGIGGLMDKGTKAVVRSASQELGGGLSNGLQNLGMSRNTADAIGYTTAGVAVGVATRAAIRGAVNTVHNVAYDTTHYSDQYYGGDQNYGYTDQQYYGGDQNYGYADQQYYGADQNYGYADQQYYGGDQNYGYADASSSYYGNWTTDTSMMASFMDVNQFASMPTMYSHPTSSLLGLTSFEIGQQNFKYCDSTGMNVFTVDTNGNVFDRYSMQIGQYRDSEIYGSAVKEFVDMSGSPIFTARNLGPGLGTTIEVDGITVANIRGDTLYAPSGEMIARTRFGSLYTRQGQVIGSYSVL